MGNFNSAEFETRIKNRFGGTIWLAFLWLLLAGILVSLFFYSGSMKFDNDEFEHIHTAWKMLQGREIYVDFFQHHHPFMYYMMMPVISIFGSTTESIFACRYIMLALTGGILIVTYLLSMRVFKNSEVGVISLILTSTMATFYMKSIEIRPDVPQTLAGLLSVYFLFVFYDRRSFRSLWLSAVFLALSFLIIQKSIALILVISALLLYDMRGKTLRPRDVLIYAAIFLLCISPYYIYLVAAGGFKQYFVMNWIVNFYFPQIFEKWFIMLAVFRENSITCVLYAIGVVALLKSKEHRRFAVLSIGLIIAVVLLFENLWRQYFMLAIPLFGIIASYALYSTFGSKYGRLVVIIGAIYVPMAIMHNHGLFKMDDTERAAQIDKINYVLSITDENDKVYDGVASFNVFREDIDYLWFCVRDTECIPILQKVAGFKYDIYESIANERPKVISNFGIHSFDDVRIKNKYRVSDRYPDLYIRAD
jgi:hypothetical protein